MTKIMTIDADILTIRLMTLDILKTATIPVIHALSAHRLLVIVTKMHIVAGTAQHTHATAQPGTDLRAHRPAADDQGLQNRDVTGMWMLIVTGDRAGTEEVTVGVGDTTMTMMHATHETMALHIDEPATGAMNKVQIAQGAPTKIESQKDTGTKVTTNGNGIETITKVRDVASAAEAVVAVVVVVESARGQRLDPLNRLVYVKADQST